MLVLGRKSDESILVGGNIKITVVSISGDTVRIGIEAPKEVDIVRDDAKNKERKFSMVETIPNQRYMECQQVIGTKLGRCDSGGVE